MCSVIKAGLKGDANASGSYVVPADRRRLLRAGALGDDEAAGAAMSEAERIIADAHAQAHEIMQRAREEGLAQGRKAGLDEMRGRFVAAVTAVETIASSVEEQADALVRSVDEEILKLAVAVAEKVMAREIQQDPAAVLPLIHEALLSAEGVHNVVIRVNPADVDAVLSARGGLVEASFDLRDLDVAQDPRIVRGGCVVEMGVGQVDARVDEMMNRIEQAFLEEHRHGT